MIYPLAQLMIYALALTKLGRNARRRPAPDHAQGIGAGHTSVGQLAGATGSGGEEGRGKKPRPALARRGRGSILLREHDGEHPHRLRWIGRVFRPELHRQIVIIQLEKELPPRDFKAAEVVLLVGIVVRQWFLSGTLAEFWVGYRAMATMGPTRSA